MKKLLMTLVACFAVFAAQAYDALYLRGTITGSSWPALPAYQFSTSDGVTYTLTLTTLSGQFKIADANWGSHNYGYNGAISLDTEYTLQSNGGNISIAGGETWNNVTLTFNLNTKKLKVTGSATANDYSCVYLVGDINGAGWNEDITSYPLNPQSGSSTTFVGSYSFTSVTYFKMKAGTLVYGTGGADINVVAGTPYTASQDGNAFVLGKGDYTFKFVLEKNAATGVLTVEGEGEEIPENYDSWYVNVLGPYNGWGDNGVNPVDGISTTTNQAIGTQGFKIKVWNGTDIYYISDNPSIPTNQWVQLYEDVYEGDPIQIDGATSNSVYTVKFNCETNQVYVELTSGGTVEPEEPEFPATMYLIGDKVNGQSWNITNPIEMSNEGDGIYTVENVKIEASDAVATADDESGSFGYFAFTTVKATDSSDWDTVNANRYGPAVNDTEITGVLGQEAEEGIQKTNTAYKINPGVYTITIDLMEGVLVMEMTEEIEIEPEPEPTPDLGDEATVSYMFSSFKNDALYTPEATEDQWTNDGSDNLSFNLVGKTSINQGVTITYTIEGNPANEPCYYVTSDGVFDLRTYTNSIMTFEAPEGYKLNKITLTTNQTGNSINKMMLQDGQLGTLTTPLQTQPKNREAIWIAPETDDEITSLVIVCTGANRIASIDVEVEKVAEPEPVESSVYVVGGGYSWDLPGTEIKGYDNVYTFTVNGKFKVSTAKAEPNDWDTFNAAAYATGNTTFGDEVTNADGQTLPVQIWGEDQELPWDGNYDITLDLTNMTMTAYTATPKPENAPDVYIRGDMNGWGTGDNYKFTNVSWDSATQTGVFTLDIAIPAGQSFKIADGGWGAINYGGVAGIKLNELTTLTYNNQTNLSLAENFDGTITFTITAFKDKATVLFTQEGEVKDPEQFYVVGTLASNEGVFLPNDGVIMESNGEGLYTANEVVLQANADGWTGFTIAANLGANSDDWNTLNGMRYGPAENNTKAVIGLNENLATGDLSWAFDPGKYRMIFDYKNLTLTIEQIPTVDYIYFASPIEVEVTKGSETPATVNVPISIQAAEPFTYQGFQFDITLPENVELASVASGLTENIDSNEVEPNTYRVLAYFDNGVNQIENIATLKLSVAYSGDPDDYPVTADVTISDSSVIFSTTSGNDIETVKGFSGEMTINLKQILADGISVGNFTIQAPSYSDAEGDQNTVTAGETIAAKVELTPENTTDSVNDIEWTSDVEGVTAKVENGQLIIDTEGVDVDEETTVTITGKIGDVEHEITITVKPVKLGDANANGLINVADVVTTAKVAAAQSVDKTVDQADVAQFSFPNANVITTEFEGKQVINSQDVAGIVNIVFGLAPDAPRNVKRAAGFFNTNDRLMADNFKVAPNKEMTIAVNLDNSYSYAALQATVVVPEGMKVVGVTKGARAAAHELVYNIGDGKVGVMLYSLSNAAFLESNDALFNLIVVADENCDDLSFENINAADAASNGYGLDFEGGRNLTGTTGINGFGIDDEEGVLYYDLNGIQIPRPDKGIYIRVENGEAVKVVK